MKERKDLRRLIIPTVIRNTNEEGKIGKKKFNTTDLIFLDDYQDFYKNKKSTDRKRRIAPTDYAKMRGARVRNNVTTQLNESTGCAWLRSASNWANVYCVNSYGDLTDSHCTNADICLRPLLHLNLKSNISVRSALQRFFGQNIQTENRDQYDIREVRDSEDKILYHTLQIGEHPKTNVNEDESQILESLYHGGKLKDGLTATGRWTTCNGAKRNKFAGIHDPHFEYNGKLYARVVSSPKNKDYTYSNGIQAGEEGTVRWAKIEPISCKILNWDEMPQNINPKGNGKAKYFSLQAEYGIQPIQFHPVYYCYKQTMWQNSTPRGFLNGIDVRNIKENGNTKYTAENGGNFTGECNFLNEAFNLSREPILEYSIPDSEEEIPDNAFNGCVTLKKLVVHQGVRSIGKNAFDGCSFKYAYRLKSGELVLDEKLPEKQEEYGQVIEHGKLARAFTNFDYGLILGNVNLTSLLELSDKLNKSKFTIPYIFVKQLQESGNLKSFVENSDFRFFRNEMPKINDLLIDFPEEERLDFFKFASAVRLFQ